MPNYCFYEMHVKGVPEQVDAFISLMTDYDAPEHFYRVFTADEYDRIDNGDGTVTAHVTGDCAWSVCSCMTKDDPITYCASHEDGTSLAEQSAKRGLDIEVFSEEHGMCFAEHYLYEHGVEAANEETSLDVYQFEPSDWAGWDDRTPEALAEFARFKEEYGLSEDIGPDDVDPDCGDIRIGGYGSCDEGYPWTV